MNQDYRTAIGCYFLDIYDINSALMTSHFCNHSDPTPAQMLTGEGKYVIGGLAELIISQDFLSDVRYVKQHSSSLNEILGDFVFRNVANSICSL